MTPLPAKKLFHMAVGALWTFEPTEVFSHANHRSKQFQLVQSGDDIYFTTDMELPKDEWLKASNPPPLAVQFPNEQSVEIVLAKLNPRQVPSEVITMFRDSDNTDHTAIPDGGCMKAVKGEVHQIFDERGRLVAQKFTPDDDIRFYDTDYDMIMSEDDPRMKFYSSFDMKN